MSTSKWSPVWLWLFLGMLLLLLFLPLRRGNATYEGVGHAHGLKIHTPQTSQKFIIDSGNLYLLRRQTYHALVLTTYVREVRWSPAQLQELRRRFPELNNDALWHE